MKIGLRAGDTSIIRLVSETDSKPIQPSKMFIPYPRGRNPPSTSELIFTIYVINLMFIV